MDAFLSDARDSLVAKLEKVSGLGVSYHSLSPSIFSSLEIHDLVVHDRLSNVQIARIERVSIRFSVVSLLLGNTENVVERITLENGSVSFSLPGQQELFDTLSSLFAVGSGNEARSGSDQSSKPVFIKAPEVTLRNLSFRYTQDDSVVSGLISSGSAKIDGSEIDYSMETKLRVQSGDDSPVFPLKGNVSLEGRFDRSLTAGSAKIIVKTLESPSFSVSRIGLVASINESVLTLDTVQDLQPVDIGLSYDFASRTIAGSFRSEQLLPFRWINIRTVQSSIRGLADLTVSGKMDFSFNENDGFQGTFALDSGVPDSFYGGGNLILDGNISSSGLTISEGSFKGPLSDILTSLSLEFGSWIPEGFLSVKKLILP
nr:hypothetical protein [Treponemataceae bacterium]